MKCLQSAACLHFVSVFSRLLTKVPNVFMIVCVFWGITFNTTSWIKEGLTVMLYQPDVRGR